MKPRFHTGIMDCGPQLCYEQRSSFALRSASHRRCRHVCVHATLAVRLVAPLACGCRSSAQPTQHSIYMQSSSRTVYCLDADADGSPTVFFQPHLLRPSGTSDAVRRRIRRGRGPVAFRRHQVGKSNGEVWDALESLPDVGVATQVPCQFGSIHYLRHGHWL